MISSSAPLDIVTQVQLNVLIQLANADNHFAPEEREMIYRISRERDFPKDKMEFLLQHTEHIVTLGALSQNHKWQYLVNCIELIFADHQVIESELNFCRGLAIKMGFKKSVIGYMIENRASLATQQTKEIVLRDFIT